MKFDMILQHILVFTEKKGKKNEKNLNRWSALALKDKISYSTFIIWKFCN